MEIIVKKEESVRIGVSHSTPNIDIGSPRSIDITVSPQTLRIEPRKSASPVFQFVNKVVRGANVVRCTLAEFEEIGTYDGQTWYAVTTTTDELRYLYLGGTLIAQARQDGTWGFAYTFPMTFGR